jgi:hypothetical protein
MALIPLNQQFHTQSGDVDTSNKGSRLANADRKSFTMQDIIDTASLSGTNTVYVAADGTPQENGVALLKGYEEAKTKVSTFRSTMEGSISGTQVLSWSMEWLDASLGLAYGVWAMRGQSLNPTIYPILVQGGETYTGRMVIDNGGTLEPIIVTAVVEYPGGAGGMLPGPTLNQFYVRLYRQDGTEILGINSFPNPNAYLPFGSEASFYPIDVTVPANLVIEPGLYDINADWIIDGLVNVTSSTGQSDVYIKGKDIKIEAGSNSFDTPITINGLNTQTQPNFRNPVSSNRSINFTDFNNTAYGVDASSIYIASNLEFITVSNCVSNGQYSFSLEPSLTGVLSGTFINCTGGNYSFASGIGNVVDAKFINCKALGGSFGFTANIIQSSTIFDNCEAQDQSFGYAATDDRAEYNDCSGFLDCFTGNVISTRPEYYRCTASSGFTNTSGSNVEDKLLFDCRGSIGTIGDNAVAFNCIKTIGSFAVAGTGKVINSFTISNDSLVNLP